MATVAIRETASLRELVAAVNNLATLVNELKADYNATLAKLDADAGVTDTNYVAQHATAAPDADTVVVIY